MTALLAPRRQHLAASGGLHARTETVRLGAPAFARLIGALWQSYPPCILRTAAPQNQPQPQAASVAIRESVSVFDQLAHGQESETSPVENGSHGADWRPVAINRHASHSNP
jgi:hypothetical protein